MTAPQSTENKGEDATVSAESAFVLSMERYEVSFQSNKDLHELPVAL